MSGPLSLLGLGGLQLRGAQFELGPQGRGARRVGTFSFGQSLERLPLRQRRGAPIALALQIPGELQTGCQVLGGELYGAFESL